MKGYAAVARALVDLEVDTVFSLLGDANLFVADELVRVHGVRHFRAAHEAGAVAMADGYARVSGRLGVATVTHGVGLSNSVTPLIEAVKNGTPLLLICGDTPASNRQHLQDIPQRELVLATGAAFEQVRSPEGIAADIRIAARRALTEAMPVVVNLPIDYEWQEVDERAIAPLRVAVQAVSPDSYALDHAFGVIARSSRPLVLAGRGAVASGAKDALLALADRLGAPVATTLLGKDLFRGDAFDLGIFGSLSNSVAADVIASTDCVIAFGAGLNDWTTVSGALLVGKRIVQVDLDPAQLGARSEITAGVVGDATKVAEKIVEWLDLAETPPAAVRSPELRARIAAHRHSDDFRDLSTQETIDVRTFAVRIDELLPVDRTLVFDVGRFIQEPMRILRVPDPGAFVFTSNFAAMGLGMPTAIGVWAARPDRPVAVVLGDGGFMMGGLTEFNTAVREGVDLIAFVLNDGGYGAEHAQLRHRGMDPALSLLDWPDLAPVADALGGRGLTVRNPSHLAAVADAIATRDRPLLVDVKLDPDVVPDIVH